MVDTAFWESPSQFLWTLEMAKFLGWLSAGAVLVDLLSFARFDYGILAGARRRRWPQLVYFGAKLAWLAYFFLMVVLLYARTEIPCQNMMYAIECCMGIVAVLCSSLLAVRTVCVYQDTERRIVQVVLGLALSGMTASWMVGVADVSSAWSSAAASPFNTGACTFVHVETHYMAKYLVTVFVDALVFLLTLVGTIRMGTSRIGEILVGQGLIYFILVLLPNVAVAILTGLRLSPVMSLIGAIPSSSISVMAATRLYVYLAEAAAPQPNGISLSQLSGSGNVEKFGNFFRSSRSGGGADTGLASDVGRSSTAHASSSPGYSSHLSPRAGELERARASSIGKMPLMGRLNSALSTGTDKFEDEDLEAGLTPPLPVSALPKIQGSGIEVRQTREVQVEQADLFVPTQAARDSAQVYPTLSYRP